MSEFKAEDKEIVDKNLIAQEMKFIKKQRGSLQPAKPVSRFEEYQEVEMYDTDCSDEEFDSDESQDWVCSYIPIASESESSPHQCDPLSSFDIFNFECVYTCVWSQQ